MDRYESGVGMSEKKPQNREWVQLEDNAIEEASEETPNTRRGTNSPKKRS